jgi:hypothetical protein
MHHMQKVAGKFGLVVILILMGKSAFANYPAEWAEVAQNPMADIIKLPIGNEFNFDSGHKNATTYTFRLNPSMPSDFSGDWSLINRLDIPFLYQPGRVHGEKDSFGLGDTTYESYFGPSGKRIFYWGVGPAFQIPTATDNQLGTKKWSAGLSGTGSLVKGPVVAGIRANHLWSFAGDDDRPDVNLSTIEYFAYYNFGRGWWIGTSPVNTANWETSKNDVWTAPLGGGIGKVVMSGRMPINLKFEAYHYIESPSNSAEWSALFTLQLLLPEDILFKKK